ncbi:amino acid/amide ABC transporter substrate-binding protein (HAAT family) [Geodermatophilus tzadiensis]|uniref:Amino acid/amide ABC transporter substrate-binding protein (HAAT family) n=1 Tax=Geodermatophilus tzadiensis TaxID=1137988 RepID=A0A2T0TQQ8_9ACTN|nr:ABC transporter substrate-binding protein [Geodermatophilus tzadiensis]PRY48006.1 amino acid/amide ABC transporter substrate-binding protein (HAAT family) [Geodermatophilus tzadiensis]
MRKHLRSRRALGIAVASAVAITLPGCAREVGGGGDGGSGGEASPGITDDSITLGITTPLSGATAGPGTCTVAGITAYFGAKNAEGGVEFGDGKTRTVEIEALDDAYDPQQAAANYDQLKDEVFAMTAGLGTPTNRAWRDAAIADEVPQVLIMTGDPLFSDAEESPWQLGFVPIYQNEGEAFGELLASSGQDHKVAILSQNDDYGEGYVEGFTSAIEGADNIEVVEQLTYEATDTSVDAQITQLAASGADVVFNAMSQVPLVVSALQKAQQLNWKPSWFLPSNTSSPGAVLEPGGGAAFPGIYSVSFAKAPASPAFAEDEDVKAYLAALPQYGNYPDPPAFPHCQWSWMVGATLEQAFSEMTEPTRENFMEALRSIEDFQAPLMLPDTTVNTTEDGQPAVSTVVVQKYNGRGYDTVESFE